MDVLGTGDFMRLYIGIGRPEPGDSVVDHVLGCPPDRDSELYTSAVSLAAWAVEALLIDSPDAVMNALNRRS
jgi:PTH1 family peptidyl-tRNA hydrolase